MRGIVSELVVLDGEPGTEWIVESVGAADPQHSILVEVYDPDGALVWPRMMTTCRPHGRIEVHITTGRPAVLGAVRFTYTPTWGRPVDDSLDWETDERGVNADGFYVWQVDDTDPAAPCPFVDSRWTWEPNLPAVRESIRVVDVVWNGEQWWVHSADSDGYVSPNELSRFWEACEPDPPILYGYRL